MSDAPETNRIIPQNLTARASYDVPGNPPSTRPESGVANCYPGLEYDHRNLDRRFFPGLVVEFVSQADANSPNAQRQGARVLAIDPTDQALRHPDPAHADLARALTAALNTLSGQLTSSSAWFLFSAEQEDRRIEFVDESGSALDGLVVWRLVRNLRRGPLKIELVNRQPQDQPAPEPVVLAGWRRSFTDDASGLVDLTYQPGELTQSLCSPWTHDFRDCSCTYWASNHPDIAMPPVPEGAEVLPSGSPAEITDSVRVDWLRDPEVADLQATALPSQSLNRPYEISYFQINDQWQDLAVVLEGREIRDRYIPRGQRRDWAAPFESDIELFDTLQRLASLEHLVALLYLYAVFSVKDPTEIGPDPRWPDLADDALFTRSVALEVAIGEMQHMRWANQLLAGVAETIGQPYEPAVEPPSMFLPDDHGQWTQPAVLQPLTLAVLQTFVDVERSSAYIDGQYARVTATLRQKRFPPTLHQLASNIAEEGEEHFLHFRDLQRILTPYGNDAPAYLRTLTPASADDPKVAAALNVYRQILSLLATGYHFADRQNQFALGKARTLMFDLQTRAEDLARAGSGLPFLDIWR